MKTVPRRCLVCYDRLAPDAGDMHPGCSRRMFGVTVPLELPYSESDIHELGLQVLREQRVVTGVQPKLSLDIDRAAFPQATRRFTIVGLWGGYILKPPAEQYPALPELEDCTMHLAALAGIRTVPHSLLRMKSGSLAYITRRIDRTKTGKLHMEDMCQISGRLTEHKYHGSHEQVAKLILQSSADPLLDAGIFFEQVLFSFLVGNADMHLKNFSLIETPHIGMTLAPAYDLLGTALVLPSDTEELALTLDGRKRKIMRSNFENAVRHAGLHDRWLDTTLRRFERVLPDWTGMIRRSFLPADMRRAYVALITQRAQRLGLGVS